MRKHETNSCLLVQLKITSALTSVSRITANRETIIVPETQDNNKMNWSEQPVSKEASNNKRKHKNNKINYKLQKHIAQIIKQRNKMRKSASIATKEISNQDEEKNTRIQIV